MAKFTDQSLCHSTFHFQSLPFWLNCIHHFLANGTILGEKNSYTRPVMISSQSNISPFTKDHKGIMYCTWGLQIKCRYFSECNWLEFSTNFNNKILQIFIHWEKLLHAKILVLITGQRTSAAKINKSLHKHTWTPLISIKDHQMSKRC